MPTPPDGLLATLVPPPAGVVFDYGNTLVPFGQREVDRINEAMVGFLVERVPGATPARATDVLRRTLLRLFRERDRTLRESDARDVPRECLAALGFPGDAEAATEEGLRALVAAFVGAVEAAAGAGEVLADLRGRGLRLGLLSNYSRGDAIRLSLEKLGFAGSFDALVVSADLGLVKPHPEVFRHVARELGLAPEEILFVGDNLKADIAGAAAVGMRTAWITEHLAGAYFFEHPEENHAEVRPDLVLDRLADLVGGNDDA